MNASRTFVIALAVSTLASGPARADLVEEGRALHDQGRYEEALERFDRAVERDPSDGRAHAWRALARLRLGRVEEALPAFEEAARRGGTAPRFDLEYGRCLFLAERHAEAIERLSAFEAANPGGWQAPEQLGVAWFRRREYAEAERWLERAIEFGTPHGAMVHFYLGQAAAQRGDVERARAHYAKVEELGPGTNYAGALPGLREALERSPPAGAGTADAPEADEIQPLKVRLVLAAGFNDNVFLQGEDQTLPSDISREEAAFFSEDFLLSAIFKPLEEETSFVVSGRTFATQYVDLHEANVEGVSPAVSWNQAWTEGIKSQLAWSSTHVWVHDEEFSWSQELTPKVSWSPDVLPWTETTLAYAWSTFDYFASLPAVLDRDGDSHTVRLTERARIPSTDLRLTLEYSHAWVGTDGREYDRETDGVVLSVGHPLPLEIDATVVLGWSSQRYRNRSVFSGRGVRRDDDQWTASAVLSRELFRHCRVFARYGYTRNESNLGIFEYDQHVVLGGLEISF